MKNNNQTTVHLGAHGAACIHHVRFQSGDLIAQNIHPDIPKPAEYNRWRIKRKETFLAGRMAVRSAQQALGLTHFDVLRGGDGAPIWPSHILGSVSHTENEAIALMIDARQSSLMGVGVDLEKINSGSQLEDESMIGLPEEFRILHSIGFQSECARLLLFSLKESVYKALYPSVGQFFDFLDVALEAEQEGVFSLLVQRDLSEKIAMGCRIYGGYKQVNENMITFAYF
ncbi:4'-phosphopantetheinyl transferase superfamily protein [Marinomonas sp. THO17]|uniref:4'-phosphopantetheinyl transferase family protein n=1 Tax=Marinomonas sp. THO17 TaxID=3149048 RepID=UPI00336BD7EC